MSFRPFGENVSTFDGNGEITGSYDVGGHSGLCIEKLGVGYVKDDNVQGRPYGGLKRTWEGLEIPAEPGSKNEVAVCRQFCQNLPFRHRENLFLNWNFMSNFIFWEL